MRLLLVAMFPAFVWVAVVFVAIDAASVESSVSRLLMSISAVVSRPSLSAMDRLAVATSVSSSLMLVALVVAHYPTRPEPNHRTATHARHSHVYRHADQQTCLRQQLRSANVSQANYLGA